MHSILNWIILEKNDFNVGIFNIWYKFRDAFMKYEIERLCI